MESTGAGTISRRCPDCGQEFGLDTHECEACAGLLRLWCVKCQKWLPSGRCAACQIQMASADTDGNTLNELVVALIQQIRDIAVEHLNAGNVEAIFGPIVYRYLGSSRGKNLTTLALAGDCLRLIVDSLHADGTLDPAEIELVLPFLHTAVAFLAQHRQEYAPFRQLNQTTAIQLIRFYRGDRGPFGYSHTATNGSGSRICQNLVRICGDSRAIDLYEKLVTGMVSQLISLGGVKDKEQQYLNRLQQWLAQMRTPAEGDILYVDADEFPDLGVMDLTDDTRNPLLLPNTASNVRPISSGVSKSPSIDGDNRYPPTASLPADGIVTAAPAAPSAFGPKVLRVYWRISLAIIAWTVWRYFWSEGLSWGLALWVVVCWMFGSIVGAQSKTLRGLQVLMVGVPMCGLVASFVYPNSLWAGWWIMWLIGGAVWILGMKASEDNPTNG
jgi:hypothetical protein